jgi:hypothetical protein
LKFKLKKGGFTMSDYGTVYFYNCTDQTLHIELNNDSNIIDVPAMGDKPDYTMSRAGVPRSGDPQPYQRAIFGLKNEIDFWLADDRQKTHKFSIDISNLVNKPGFQTDDDLIFYVYFQSMVLRVQGDAFQIGTEAIDGDLAPIDS